jgi:hypothetical protein
MILSSPQATLREIFVELIRSKLDTKFAASLGRLSFYSVAARPKQSPLPFAYGLDVVFEKWAAEDLSYYPVRPQVTPPITTTEFDKYLSRRLPSAFSSE